MKGLTSVGEWLSLVEHLVRDQGVGGSNPLSPTNSFPSIQTFLSALRGRQIVGTTGQLRANAPLPARRNGAHGLEHGSCYLMVKVSVLDFPPPGAGFLTSMEAVPVDATSAAGT